MAEVCVLGLGYVGLPMASLLATTGVRVLGVDVNPAIVERLRAGRTHLSEAGLATLVAAARHSGNLTPATLPEPSETFLICVPTPVTPSSGADLSMVTSATRSILPHLRRGNLVILESTSPLGTTRRVVGRILEESGLEAGRDFDLCYCPERVLPGNTISELINNDRLLGGVTLASARRARDLYERFCQGRITLTDDRTAEMCKLMENTYRDVNIALANVFARIAEDAGLDVWRAIELANRHPRVQIHQPGPGVGGHCIPIDPLYLVEDFPQHTALLRDARRLNDTQGERFLAQLAAAGSLRPGDRLAILGAAYKADIDDPRETPAGPLAAAAQQRGLTVSVHDPLVPAGVHHGLTVGNDLPACLRGAAAAALLVEHKAYRSLTAGFFAEHLAGRLIGDARNALDHQALRQYGFTVVRLGAAG